MHITADRWLPLVTLHRETNEQPFFRSVFGWMCAGLLLTAASAAWVVFSSAIQEIVFMPGFTPLLFIIELTLVFGLASGVEQLKPATAAGVFLGYSLLNGFTLSSIAFAYAGAEIFSAFAVAAGMFGVMGVYGRITKRDLGSLSALLFMGLIGVVIASGVSLFARSSALTFGIDLAGVLVFLGLTAWDAQRLKALAAEHDPEVTNIAIVGALALYLDLLNTILLVLQPGGRRRQEW